MPNFFNFIRETGNELRKATWPWDPREKGIKKYKQLIDSTFVVIIAMLIIGGTVAFFDLALLEFISAICGTNK